MQYENLEKEFLTMMEDRIQSDFGYFLEQLPTITLGSTAFLLLLNLNVTQGLDSEYKVGGNSSELSINDPHRHKPFLINNVRKLFNSAGDLEGINQGYTTHIY